MSSAAHLRHRTPASNRSLTRAATAWLGIFCLYLQLAAAAVCVASGGPSVAAAAPSTTDFPICHGQASHDTADRPSPGAPNGHEGPCPFCALHGHAMAAGPTASIAAPIARTADRAPLRRPRLPWTTRVRIAAPPRGPPLEA